MDLDSSVSRWPTGGCEPRAHVRSGGALDLTPCSAVVVLLVRSCSYSCSSFSFLVPPFHPPPFLPLLFAHTGLGASAESKYLRPQEVKSLSGIGIVDIACGDNVTMALSKDGRLFAFGAGETNQIPGHPEDVHTPVQIAMPFDAEDTPVKGRAIKEISVANINCAALADNGTVWVWSDHTRTHTHARAPVGRTRRSFCPLVPSLGVLVS